MLLTQSRSAMGSGALTSAGAPRDVTAVTTPGVASGNYSFGVPLAGRSRDEASRGKHLDQAGAAFNAPRLNRSEFSEGYFC
jgi:hypothetical protein